MSFEIGQIVGGYEIVGAAGAGGMGTVYRVKNPITDRVDAMKVLLSDLSGATDLASRFLREIKIHASLRHPNIATLYTAMQLGNELLMVMEFVDGMSLERRFTYGPLGIAEAMDYMRQMLSALGYAHEQGVVHRDIKPSNIMITAEGGLKLLDFGIARGQFDPHITSTGMVIGSLLYMSPEQIQGGNVDARSDLYSAAVTLYQMVTERRPFEETNPFELIRAHSERVPIPPCNLTRIVDPELSRVIMKALEKDPAARFQNAAAFDSALAVFRPGIPVKAANAATVAAAVPSSPFPADALRVLERLLAPYAGPIARHMVKKTSHEVSTLSGLVDALTSQLDSTRDRELFRKAARQELGLTASTPEVPAATISRTAAQPLLALDPIAVENIKRALSALIGPVAKILVDRTSKKASNLQELCLILSQEIPSAKDREAFMARSFRTGFSL